LRQVFRAVCDALRQDAVTVAIVSLTHAVLALVAERRGYGYELVQRFEARLGPAWRLNPSAVYPALDQLERRGLVTSAARHGGTRRSPRIVYAATPAGSAALDDWLGAAKPTPEPVRAELHLRLAFAQCRHRAALAGQLASHAHACEELLARYPRPRTGAGPALVDAAVVIRLHAELAWLAHARARIEEAEG
jgi:DNA-binding PadR family transcriptional regulator